MRAGSLHSVTPSEGEMLTEISPRQPSPHSLTPKKRVQLTDGLRNGKVQGEGGEGAEGAEMVRGPSVRQSLRGREGRTCDLAVFL